MNRRTAITNIVFVSAGAVLLPSCLQNDKAASFPLKNISLTGSQENMLAELSETILPKTNNFIGAKDLKAHEFVLTMVDDCGKPEDQQNFTEGMKQFEDICQKKWNNSFVKCTLQQRNEILSQLEKKQDMPEPVLAFYKTVKRYTVQSFTSSKIYMTDIRHYKMVPGSHFKGCVPLKQA
jgi:Gluconate 2-dehydrogenase subunit 3